MNRWAVAAPAAWVLAGVAVAGAITVTTVGALLSPTLPGLVAYAGGFGTVVLALAVVFGLPMLVGVGVAGLTGACALSLVGAGSGLRVDAVAAGVALVVITEAAYRSLEWREPLHVSGAVLVISIAPVAAVLLAAAAGGVALLAGAASVGRGGLAVEAAGALAALAVVGVIVGLARNRA